MKMETESGYATVHLYFASCLLFGLILISSSYVLIILMVRMIESEQ